MKDWLVIGTVAVFGAAAYAALWVLGVTLSVAPIAVLGYAAYKVAELFAK